MSAITAASESEQATYDPVSQLDSYEYLDGKDGREPGWFKQLLWWCAGADATLLKHCPRSDHVKEEGIGGTVLATALLAALSGGYAFYTVFSPKVGFALSGPQQALDTHTLLISIIFATVWSAIILNLDRFVVSSTGHGDGTDDITWKELWRAVPRLLLAIIIGFSLSKPLEIRIMKTEIEAQLEKDQRDYASDGVKEVQAAFDVKKADLTKKIAEAEAKIKEKEALLEKMRMEVVEQGKVVGKEAAGESGSGKYGKGPGYQAKKEAFDKLEAAFQSAEKRLAGEQNQLALDIKEADKELDRATKARDDGVLSKKDQSHALDGLVNRMEIAHRISPVATWALMLLLMTVEVVPIFFKMMLTKGPYDYLVENQKELVKARYAIETIAIAKPGKAAESEEKKTFNQAETVREFQVGQLQVEQNLTRVAQEVFSDQVQADIRTNPGKYMSPSDSKPG